MKKEYLKIQINDPCDENWEGMTPIQKDKFCGSCEKIVVDFTAMTDGEIVRFYKKHEGNLCGRFHKDQLNRKLFAPSKASNWTAWKAAAALAAGMMLGQEVEAQVQPNRTEWHQSNETLIKGKVIAPKSNIIEGTVTDEESGEPLIGANVVLKDKDGGIVKGTYTDFDGKYVIEKVREAVSLEVSYTGFDFFISKDFGSKKKLDVVMKVGVTLESVLVTGLWVRGDSEYELGTVIMSSVVSKEWNVPARKVPTFTKELIVFPNPFSEYLSARVEVPQADTYLFQLYSMTGQLVFAEAKTLSEGSQAIRLQPNPDLATGAYVLVVSRDGVHLYSKQVVKGE